MSAQRSNQMATSQPRQEQRGQPGSGLARRSALPSLPSLLVDPLGFFDDDPFSLMRRMQREMTRVFGQAGLDGQRQSDDLLSTAWIPATEIAYRDGNLIVSAELPGLSENDVRVEVNNDFLIIQGERKMEQQEDQNGIQRTERRYGQFYRAIALPDGADTENARAEFDNGVLRVTIPVPEAKTNQRQIPIQASQGSQSSQGAASSQGQQQRQQGSETSGGQKAA